MKVYVPAEMVGVASIGLPAVAAAVVTGSVCIVRMSIVERV